MSGSAASYFYVVTINLLGPGGVVARTFSDSGTFLDADDLTEQRKLGQTLKAVSANCGVWLLKGHSDEPNFDSFTLALYQCTQNLGAVGGLGVGLLKRELGFATPK